MNSWIAKRYKNPRTCVYKICYENYIYIGSAVVFSKRKFEHLWALKNNRHVNPILQNIYNKYGSKSLHIEIIEQCDLVSLLRREQFWIDHYKNDLSKKIINICPVAGNSLGVKQSEETCEKKRKAMIGKNKGKKRSLEQRTEQSRRQQGRVISKEWREKLSAATKGRHSHRHQTKRFVLKDNVKYSFSAFAKIMGLKTWEMYQPYNSEKYQEKFNCLFIKEDTY